MSARVWDWWVGGRSSGEGELGMFGRIFGRIVGVVGWL